MSEKLLEIKNLTVQYKTDDSIVHAVNGINLLGSGRNAWVGRRDRRRKDDNGACNHGASS